MAEHHQIHGHKPADLCELVATEVADLGIQLRVKFHNTICGFQRLDNRVLYYSHHTDKHIWIQIRWPIAHVSELEELVRRFGLRKFRRRDSGLMAPTFPLHVCVRNENAAKRIAQALVLAEKVRPHAGDQTASREALEYESRRLTEGKAYTILSTARERKLVARQLCLAHYGTICVICGDDLEKKYGPIGKHAIQVHHLKTIASASGERPVDPIQDLRPVCPNCHAVLHAGGRNRTLKAVKALLCGTKIV